MIKRVRGRGQCPGRPEGKGGSGPRLSPQIPEWPGKDFVRTSTYEAKGKPTCHPRTWEQSRWTVHLTPATLNRGQRQAG